MIQIRKWGVFGVQEENVQELKLKTERLFNGTKMTIKSNVKSVLEMLHKSPVVIITVPSPTQYWGKQGSGHWTWTCLAGEDICVLDCPRSPELIVGINLL